MFLRCLSPLGVEAYVPIYLHPAGWLQAFHCVSVIPQWLASVTALCMHLIIKGGGHHTGRASVISPSLLDELGASKAKKIVGEAGEGIGCPRNVSLITTTP
jgi:hypothetical protein